MKKVFFSTVFISALSAIAMAASVQPASERTPAKAPLRAKVTYIGTATVLIELLDGEQTVFRILTDPALDPAREQPYRFKFGTQSIKKRGATLPAGGMPDVDLVLLSHDEHADNLDDRGRAYLPHAKQILTTASGARRLLNDPSLRDAQGQSRLAGKIQGLTPWKNKPWDRVRFPLPDSAMITVTAVPARHAEWPFPVKLGPVQVAGDAIGFVLEWPGQQKGPVYISGDTVYFSGIPEIHSRFPKIGTAFIHLGAVRFPKLDLGKLEIPNPTREVLYTFNGKQAAHALHDLQPQVVIPLHFNEDKDHPEWTHFHENLPDSEKAIIDGGTNAHDLVHLVRGQPVEIQF